ncbi:MAG: methylenetetrahydrofolate reductase [Candidatus Cyclobacteriaceae bacterium M3_2C_046]
MFLSKIHQKETGIVTYGITPPKTNNSDQKLRQIALKQIERISGLDLDGLIVYDIQDESARNPEHRPFPFLPTLDPGHYASNYLKDIKIPKVIYKSVAKYSLPQLEQFLIASDPNELATVFVGASSSGQMVQTTLKQAYQLYYYLSRQKPLLGAVTIPERHVIKQNEHLKILKKMDSGCSFFVSQAVYNAENSKNVLSDYYYLSLERQVRPAPMIMTLTPCGSTKTLQFMRWLGVDIPRWLENDLLHAKDILQTSVEVCLGIFRELWQFGREKGIPIGFNIESVAIRRSEIEAAIYLAHQVRRIIKSSQS